MLESLIDVMVQADSSAEPVEAREAGEAGKVLDLGKLPGLKSGVAGC